MSKVLHPEILHLSNGIPVILQNFDSEVSAVYWWVKTGSADERPKEAGFAHFLEHMHFKDTDAKSSGRASTGEMARAIESLGGDINAYTSFDQTVYHVTCAAHHWEKVLKVFGAMAKPQKFLKQDFEQEREVILEELKKNEDTPSRMLFQSLFTATFAKHPYGRPVIGYEKTLKAAKVGDLEAFYRRQYVSGNMGLVLVGPYDEKRKKAVLAIAEQFYGSKVIKKKPAAHVTRPLEASLRPKTTFGSLPFDVTTPTLAFSFRVPDLQDASMPALDVMSSVLCQGESSRLYQSLFYGKSIVTEVGGGLYVPKDPGMLYFTADTESLSQLEPALQGILDEVQKLKTQLPTDEEIARVITTSESERYYAAQTADGVASRLGFLQYQLGDLTHDRKYIDEMKSVDSDQIREVIEEFVNPNRMSLTLMLPEKEKDFDLRPIQETVKRFFSDQTKSPKTKRASGTKKENLPTLIQLDSGARVLYRERPNSHVMSIHSAVLGGLRLEIVDGVKGPEYDQGVSNILSNVWAKGTTTKTAKQITEMIEGAAANLDGFSGRNTVGLHTVGLARDWPRLSELFTDCLLNPTFPKEEVDLTRKVVEESIRSIEDHSSALCSKLFHETLFQHHPYGKYAAGTLQSVGSIDSDRLKAFHSKWVRPERLVISVVGNVWKRSLDVWLQELDEKLKALPKNAGSNLGLDTIGDEPDLRGPRWVDRALGREQVHIIVGGLGLKFSDQERHAMRVLQNLLGGQSGKLFIELREKKSLAYSVAPIDMQGIERGYAATYIACSPAKKQEAIEGIKKVYEQLAKKGPSASEMKRAKEYYLGRRAMDLQGDSSLSNYYTLENVYNLPVRSEEEIIRSIEAVTAKQVQDVCRKYYVDSNTVTAVVG